MSWIIFQEILRHYDLFFVTDIKIVPFYEY